MPYCANCALKRVRTKRRKPLKRPTFSNVTLGQQTKIIAKRDNKKMLKNGLKWI